MEEWADQDESTDPDEWTEQDEELYQARLQEQARRRRRVRRQALAFFVIVLVVLGAGVGAYGVWTGWWEVPDRSPSQADTTACPTPAPTAAPERDVTVVVLNATVMAGLAGDVAAGLRSRGMSVRSVGNDAPWSQSGAAQVRHGPDGLAAARTVAAHVPGAELVDDGRTGSVVELSIGPGYAGLSTPEEAAELTAPPAPDC